MEHYVTKTATDIADIRAKIQQIKQAKIKIQDQINTFKYTKQYKVYFKYNNTFKNIQEVQEAFVNAKYLYLTVKLKACDTDIANYHLHLEKPTL